MKYSFFSFILLCTLFLFSCDSDKSFEDDKTSKSELREGDVMSNKDCFEFEFPIGIVFPDKKVKKINDEEEFYVVIKKWYETNPKEKEKPGLEYPIEVIFKGEISKTIDNEKDMISLKKFCDGGYDKECFELVYPISYEMPDGTIVTGENDDEVITAMKSWYEAHAGSKEKPSLVYPVDVVLKDGSTDTINNEDEMIELKKEC